MAAGLADSVEGYRFRAHKRARTSLLFVGASSLAVAGLLLLFPPGWLAVTLCMLVAFAVATWYRPVVGVAVVLFLTLLFEQYEFAYFRPVTRLVPLFENMSQSTGLRGVEASPLELLLVMVAFVVLVRIILRRQAVQRNPLTGPILVFAAALCVWMAYGLIAGGTLNTALWELRALAYLCLLAFVVPQAVNDESDVRLLLAVALVAIALKSVQGVWNYAVVLQGDLTGVRSITSHEDALFIAVMIVYLVLLSFYRAARGQFLALLLLSPVMVWTFVATDRRAAVAALILGLCAAAALIATDGSKRALLAKVAVPVVLAMAVLVVAGWNVSGPIGMPAGIVKSIAAPDNPEDKESTYYRRAEEVNLIRAIESDPVVGLGFGRPFQSSGQGGIALIAFSLRDVIPHNEIMWIWAKMGTLGFALFWAVIGGMIAFGGLAFRTAASPYLKVVAGLVTCALIMQIVVSYVDLQLTYARNMVLLGVLVGTLARLPALQEESQRV